MPPGKLTFAILASATLTFCLVISGKAATVYTTDFTFHPGDYDFSVEAHASAHGTILGGWIENRLQLIDTSSADLYGGNVNALYVGANSTANIWSGAYINTYIGTSGNGVLDLHGGRMPDRWITSSDTSLVNFYVRTYTWTPGAGQWGDGQITGIWADQSPFTVDLQGPQTISHLAFYIVPEPAAISTGLIGLLCIAAWLRRAHS